MNGRRHSAARRAGQKIAQQTRLSRSSQAAKQRPGGRQLAEQMRRDAQQAATSRARAAAAAQQGKAGMEGPKPDSIPVSTATIGLGQAQAASDTLDWPAPSGGRGSGGGGGAGGAGADIEAQGFWGSLSPLHKLLAIGAAGWIGWRLSKRK